MDPATIAFVQAGTVTVGAFTAIINLLVLTVRSKVDPSALQVIERQSAAMEKSNERNAKSLEKLHTQLTGRVHNVDKTLISVQSQIEKLIREVNK